MTNAPLKILMHHRLASQDGQAVHLLELKSAFERAGHQVILVGPKAFQAQSFGGEIQFVAKLKKLIPAWLFELAEVGYNVFALYRLAHAIIRHRPDFIYERYSLFLLAGSLLRTFVAKPFCLEINSPLWEERSQHDQLQLQAVGRFCQRWIWRRADLILPVTDVLAGYARSLNIPNSRILVVPNGIDPKRFIEPPEPEASKASLNLTGKIVLGFVGFVRGWNRLDRVLDWLAMSGRRDLHLLVIGDGPSSRDLRTRAANLGVAQRITITGVVDRPAVAANIAAIDIALVPGVTVYASPLKLFEYMAMGKAILAVDSPNIREVLTHGVNAWLFSDESFSRGLEILTTEPALRQRLGIGARARIQAGGYNWDRNAERIVARILEIRADAFR